MMFEKHLSERYALKQQDLLKTAYLEEMGISILCSLSGDDSEHYETKKCASHLRHQPKRKALKKKTCTWPHSMLITFIDLARTSEKSRRENNELSSGSSDVQSLSDFDAETEREHESETDTDTDFVEMELDATISEKSQ